MAKYLGDIVDYFRGLCENHPDLQHTAAVGQRVFQAISVEEALSDFRTAGQEKTFFVRLVLPTMTMLANGNNSWKKYQCGLMVGRYYSTREDASAESIVAFSEAERIADDFMARIVYDSRSGHNLFTHTADSIDALEVTGEYMPASGDGSFSAVLYTFTFGTFRCLDADGSEFAAWDDL
jgi:hypothetical protein